jgi:hypothetical protein
MAAVDPSGGSSDSMTLAIAHADGERGILDLVREWRPPFSPESVVIEIASICRQYGLTEVIGDRFGGEWPRERFRVHGIEYEIASMPRSDAYLTLLPALNTPGQIELLDNPRLISQLCQLERHTGRSGKDSVDHPRNSHDDVINAAALALVAAALAQKSSAANWIEYYRRQNEAAGIAVPKKPEFGHNLSPEKPKVLRIRVPGEITTLCLSDGRTVQVPPNRIVEVPEFDAIAYGMRGWERLSI